MNSTLETVLRFSWQRANVPAKFRGNREASLLAQALTGCGKSGDLSFRRAEFARRICFLLSSTKKQILRSPRRPQDDNKRTFSAACLILALAVVAIRANAQDTAYPPAASVLQPKAYVSLQPVPAGRAFEIAVVAKISPGFHINAHVPSEDYLIPTKITADLPPGVLLVEATYPHGVMRAFRFSKTPLRVYEGSFTVKMKLRASSSAPVGPQKIGLTVGYQACNQDACLPPTKIPVTVDLEIAAVDTPAHPVHAEIFSATPAEK